MNSTKPPACTSGEQRSRIMDLLHSGQAAPDEFAPYLNNRDSSVRQAAIEALNALETEDAARLVAPCINDPDSTVRVDATESVGRFRHVPAIPNLIDRMQNDRTWLVRVCAAEAMGDIGEADDNVLSALAGAMERDRNELVRAYAADSIGRLGATSMRPRILAQFERDRSARARASMLQALYRLGDEDALHRLLRMLQRVRRWEMEAAILNLIREIMDPRNRDEIRDAVGQVTVSKPTFAQFHRSDADLFGDAYRE